MNEIFPIVFSALLLVGCLVLAMRCFWRPLKQAGSGTGEVSPENFRNGDLLFVLMLFAWFGTSIFFGFVAGSGEMSTSRIIEGGLFFILIVTAIFAFTKLRGVSAGFGFSRMGAGGVVMRGVLYLLAAYPLVITAGIVSRLFVVEEPGSQAIVDYFLESDESGSRVLVIFLAVVLAPVSEEFIFRGYLYGVLKKYAGFTLSILATSLLFALIHLHVPSIGVLLVLSICLTLAYEATGSVFVPMIMHALFNSVSVAVMLWAPHLVP